MGDQPQERKIGELCTPDIIDLPILNLAEIGSVTSLMFIFLMTLPSSINQVYLAHNHVDMVGHTFAQRTLVNTLNCCQSPSAP
jgi:hypothetical protein